MGLALALARRLPVAVVAALVGAGTGIATVALHDWWWGLAFGAVASLLAAVAVRPGWSTRLAYGLGWDGMVGWLTVKRPEGDFVVSADAQGYAVLGLGLALLLLCVATLPRPAAPASDRRSGSGSSSHDPGELAGRRAGTAPAR